MKRNPPANFIDLTGSTFGCLRVVGRSPRTNRIYTVFWECACSCGRTAVVSSGHLRSGHTNSCGCLVVAKCRIMGSRQIHGRSHTPEFKAWDSMRQRCHNPKSNNFKNYGAKGITICQRWDSFEAFLSDMGQRPGPTMSIDRIDNKGNYEPTNCRWATKKRQACNRSTNRLITFAGQTLALSEWAEIKGIDRRTLLSRLNNGWSVADALCTLTRPRAYCPQPTRMPKIG